MTTKRYINLSGYKFVTIPLLELNPLQERLKQAAVSLGLKGTILLGTEGINAFMAGERDAIDTMVEFIHSFEAFNDLHFKESESQDVPFDKMLVRIKKEIVTMGHSEIQPGKKTAPYVGPEELKQWYDEELDFVILDTRNDYEVALGTFENAQDLNIDNFREFPDAVDSLPEEMKDKPVVTFCTGGIRCEKAAELMSQKGFKKVFQLDGGILNYFEKVGGDHYQGECFVFDKRVSVNNALEATVTDRCTKHINLETADDLQASIECPYCQHLQETRRKEAHSQAA